LAKAGQLLRVRIITAAFDKAYAKCPSQISEAYDQPPLSENDFELTNLSLERFRTSTKYQDRPAAADIAFCVAAYANGMTENRIERALEDDYLSRDPSTSKRAAYIRRTMEKARRWAER
jgi:hypothetical protein